MDWQLVQTDDGNFDIDARAVIVYSIRNSVILRLFSRAGEWWANPKMGSRLHTLGRERMGRYTAQAVKEYCEGALRHLVDSGRAKSIRVDVEQDGLDKLGVSILVDEDVFHRFRLGA